MAIAFSLSKVLLPALPPSPPQLPLAACLLLCCCFYVRAVSVAANFGTYLPKGK